jgi:hypothetical protein
MSALKHEFTVKEMTNFNDNRLKNKEPVSPEEEEQ